METPAHPTKHTIPPTLILDGRVAVAFLGDVSLLITNVAKWSKQDLLTVLEETNRIGGRRNNPHAYTHYFGEIFGGDATQRKLIVDWQSAHNVPQVQKVLNITDSAVMRAALTAYAWMTKTDAKAFKSNDLEAACHWLAQGSDANPADVLSTAMACYKLLRKTPAGEAA